MKVRLIPLVVAVSLVLGAVGFLSAIVSAISAPIDVPSVTWTDTFSSTTLDSRWSWVRKDRSHWSLTARPGFLRIITQHGGLSGPGGNSKNILLQLAPVGDFEIQTRLLFTPIELFHEAGLIVYRDDDNYLLLVRSYPCSQPSSPPCVGNGIYFYHVEHDSNIDRIFTMTTSAPGEAYLRIVRHGRDYTGYVSSDGASWIALGTHTVTSGLLLSKIGLIADNGHTYATEIPADFDFFTLIDHSQRLYLPLIIK